MRPCPLVQGLGSKGVYLTESVHKVVFLKSISARIFRVILYYLYEESVEIFVRELTFATRLYKHFLCVIRSEGLQLERDYGSRFRMTLDRGEEASC